MKLSEIKGEAAIDVLADLIDPMSEIISDKEIETLFKMNAPKLKLVKTALKKHKKEVIEILAVLDGESPETYDVNIVTLPLKVLELLNDPMVANLFQSQGQKNQEEHSGSAMGNTEGKGL